MSFTPIILLYLLFKNICISVAAKKEILKLLTIYPNIVFYFKYMIEIYM